MPGPHRRELTEYEKRQRSSETSTRDGISNDRLSATAGFCGDHEDGGDYEEKIAKGQLNLDIFELGSQESQRNTYYQAG